MKDTPSRNAINKSGVLISNSKVDRVVNAMEDVYSTAESSVKIQKNIALTQGMNSAKSFNEYKMIQNIQQRKLAATLKRSKEAIASSLNEANKSIKKIAGVTPKMTNSTDAGLLVASVFTDYKKDLLEIKRLTSTMPLNKAITKQTQLGVDKGVKVNYYIKPILDDKTGEVIQKGNTRQVSFKSYMEMKVRTEVSKEITNNLQSTSRAVGIVFYLCDYFGDCAKDHIDLQGKYYYDEGWNSLGFDEETSNKIESAIGSYNMMSVSEAKAEGLTTRPNCRHTLSPVSLDEVIDTTPTKMLDKLGKKYNGKQSDKKSEALVMQRKNERAIRTYKNRVMIQRIQLKKTHDPNIKLALKANRAKLKQWKDTQEDLLKEVPTLKRDTRREDNTILVQDLGAGYHLGLKEVKNVPVLQAKGTKGVVGVNAK